MLKLERKTTRLQSKAVKLKGKPKADPLGVEYSGDAAADSKAEMDAVKGEFQVRRENEAKRFKDATDSEYWVAMCFQSREQKEEFLRALNLIQHGDKYLDGMKVAQTLGVELKTEFPEAKKLKTNHTTFTNLIREVN